MILSGFQVANDVLFPFYARLKEGAVEGDDELRRGYLETVRLGSMVAFPAAFGMAALALPLVLTLYGEKWRAAAEPLALVAIWAGLASLASMPGAVFKALGRSWLLAATGIMQIAILFPADPGSPPTTASRRWRRPRCSEKTVSLALLGVIIGRILDIPWYATFTAGAPALALSVMMAAVLYPLTHDAAARSSRSRSGSRLAALVYLALLRRFDARRLPDAHAPAAHGRSRHDPCGRRELMWARTAVVVSVLAGRGRGRGLRRVVVAAGRTRAAGSARLDQPSALLRRPGRPRLEPRDQAAAVPDARARAAQAARRRPPLRPRRHLPRAHQGARRAGRPRRARARLQLPRRATGRARDSSGSASPRYWTIRGINVTWAAGNPDEPMARIYGGTGWELTGAEIWGAHSTSGLHVDDGPAQQPRQLGREGQLHPRHAPHQRRATRTTTSTSTT